MRKSAKTLLMIAGILCIIRAVIDVLACVCLVLDLGGTKQMVIEMISQLTMYDENVTYYIASIIMELVFNIIISIYGANYFIKASRVKIVFMYNITSAITMGIIQILFSSVIVGTLSIIASFLMRKGNVSQGNPFAKETVKDVYGNNIYNGNIHVEAEEVSTEEKVKSQMEDMTQAVQKLKSLKENGVISEEEYYEHLNKILEGKK
ncbi:MAG: SHOCT domain-containing protein [Clostridia bacterium]|nr:SHOCT domain-containing protein [Clostridia bacterium]